jgi:hypothetical protein
VPCRGASSRSIVWYVTAAISTTHPQCLCQLVSCIASERDLLFHLAATASMIMSDRLGATSSRSKTIIAAYGLVAPWQTPYRSVFKMLQYGYKLGMRTGEVMPQSNMPRAQCPKSGH